MNKSIILCLFFFGSFSLENKKAIEITRYELGKWECSNSIELIGNQYFHNPCKWGNSQYTLITDNKINEFISSINKQMIENQLKTEYQKDKCGITKYSYEIKYDGIRYSLNEVLCKNNPNGILVNKLHDIFLKIQ